jgi:hypothetical protein
VILAPYQPLGEVALENVPTQRTRYSISAFQSTFVLTADPFKNKHIAIRVLEAEMR